MGHGTNDKLFITPSEHVCGRVSRLTQQSGVYGQHGATTGARKTDAVVVPYHMCALTHQPWTDPVTLADEGLVYERDSVAAFLEQHGVSPATGRSATHSDLRPLHFAKSERGAWMDPVSCREFTDHSHMVFVRPTGNVFLFDTVQQLNLKPRRLRDLVTDEPFQRGDVIMLQDPHNPQHRTMRDMHHVQNRLTVTQGGDAEEVNAAATGSTQGLLAALRAKRGAGGGDRVPARGDGAGEEFARGNGGAGEEKGAGATAPAPAPPPASDPRHIATTRNTIAPPQPAGVPAGRRSAISTGLTAASFTSSGLTPRTKTEHVAVDEEQEMFDHVARLGAGKGKAYVRLTTTYGPLNLELYADKAPKTCYNFITLCREGKYVDTLFHRNVPGFMIQGGDPTGTGRGGASIWGRYFADELDRQGALRHTGRGILSMANRGKNTNGSQFFLTYRAIPHLDSKHTAFGQLVSDAEHRALFHTLDVLERIPNEPGTDRPVREVRITEAHVVEDPFAQYREQRDARRRRENPDDEERTRREAKRRKREDDRTTWLGTQLPRDGDVPPAPAPAPAPAPIALADEHGLAGLRRARPAAAKPRAKPAKGGFGDFAGW
ncbi:peptidylprolyl isomerase [Malassezia sp. CBS 17886]|nr:peptidylprolyl isomerase [Malassezia sp. CBS 17886]